MEDDNFVADSDEDEQELLDAMTLAEERLARQQLELATTIELQQVTERHEDLQEQEQKQHAEMLQRGCGHETAQEISYTEQHGEGKEKINDEHANDEDEATEAAKDEDQVDGGLKVGTVVEVESRTWPGINKQGGAGRITCVYREKPMEGADEEMFYDVRYVLGGFERHIEHAYVHSSKLLNKQSNREKVSREYYHDNYINEPHRRKQREAEEKRDQRVAPVERQATHVLHRRKRKRARPSTQVDQLSDTMNEDSSSSDVAMEKRSNVHTIHSDDALLPAGTNKSLLDVASHEAQQTVHDTVVEQSVGIQRRRHRIVDSSDEEGTQRGGSGDNSGLSPDQYEYMASNGAEPRAIGRSARGSRTNLVGQYWHRNKKARADGRRFVGGYEHNEDDADGKFIQPEGNPDDLPDDIIRVTGFRLETTRDGLMKQLQEVFVQQQINIAAFHEEQKNMNKERNNLSEMPLCDLRALYRRVVDLEEHFLTKTLVNAGEDVMDTISRKLERCGKLPTAFEQVDRDIDDWKEELKQCSQWMHTVRDAVEDALSQRNALGKVVQAESSSDSSYAANNNARNLSSDTAGDDDAPDNVDLSFDYETERVSDTRVQKRQRGSLLNVGARRLISSRAIKQSHRRQTSTRITLDDYEFWHESSNRLTSNIRLPGKQKKKISSDPRWAWVKIAWRKQQRARRGIRNQLLRTSSLGLTNEHVNVHDVRSTNVLSRDDSTVVQAQRMHLRNKKFRDPPKQWRSSESVFTQRTTTSGRSSSHVASAADISFDDITLEQTLESAKAANSNAHISSSKPQIVDWEAIFDAVMNGPSASPDEDSSGALSQKGQVALLAFGHRLCGPLASPHLFSDEDCEFEDCENFEAVVSRRTSRLRQLLNTLRLQENTFMDSLSKESFDAAGDEEKYINTPPWLMLVALEEAFHEAIARLVAQLLQTLERISTSDFASCLRIIVDQIAALVRQLPDCNSIVNGCKAYFFFFEVASRDATTTPFLTAVLRTYWYCLDLLVALRSISDRLAGQHVRVKQEIENGFQKALPVNRFILAVMLFLFDLYIYLPLSHRVEDKSLDEMLHGSSPALSLWMLVRDCSDSSTGGNYAEQASLSTKEQHVWALLQAVYRQRYFDLLAGYFVRNESCGGYLRDFEPSAADTRKSEVCDEILESQLLSLETTWNLVAIISQIYAENGDKHEESVCDAKWAIVKDLLQHNNPYFLPFIPDRNQSIFLQADYCRSANIYKQHVLRRVTTFSRHWRPSKGIVEHILRQLCRNNEPSHSDAVVELPQLFKHFLTRCRELGNSKSRLAAFAGAEYADDDPTTALCNIIWIQLLKLEKRVHRSRFRRSILSAVPENEQVAGSIFTQHILLDSAGADWTWGLRNDVPVTIPPTKRPEAQQPLASTKWKVEKIRTSTAVLLVFAIVEVCLECGDEQHFPIDRPEKDIRYMEREVDFYCKEILRWRSEKLECDVLAAQALFTLGALLLEKNSTEFPTVFWGLNDRLESSMKSLLGNTQISPTPKQSLDTNSKSLSHRRQRSRGTKAITANRQRAAMSPLYHMRDLIRKMLPMPSVGMHVGPAFKQAVIKSLEHIFSTGIEACLNLAAQRIIEVYDLKIAVDIFQLLLARAPDEPNRCFALSPPPGIFDDDFDDALALLDMNEMLVGRNSGPPLEWTVRECRPKVIQLITSNLRVTVQHLVLHYPSNDATTFEELYVIDLLGLMISTCNIQFSWHNLTTPSVKSRNLAPRVLGSALKYNNDAGWLRNVFSKEIGDLSIAWLMGTLDVAAFNCIPIRFRLEDVPFSMDKQITQKATTQNLSCVYESDYWVLLTDGIIYNLLRSDLYGFGANDSHVLKLLREVASTCKFRKSVRANKAGLRDTPTLYDLHLNVFQSFCQRAGNTYSSYAASHANYRHEMNQFRAKMVNPSNGIFVPFLEAYKLNFRRACREIDHWNHNWHEFAKLFLRQAGVNVGQGRSYHELDDLVKTFDKRLTGLTTMFQFMYQCMDAFLFHCGEMAIGETNLFLITMELLFRQVNSAEYPQAIKRLENQRRQIQRDGVRSVKSELFKGVCSAAMRFVDSVQLFFALQKYPSLLHWFAQTSEIYQTLQTGWLFSPLRTLLVNILDPDGPLGIHSYYPDEEASNDSHLTFDVKAVRREAFYLSCGVFNCRCTRSFEHSRAEPISASCERLQRVRKFVLDDFMRETLAFVLKDNASLLLETMVPLCQFVRAVLNHANLNAERTSAKPANDFPAGNDVSSYHFQLDELYPCLEWMVESMIKLITGEDAVNNAMCCVLLIELCGIISEAIAFNSKRPMLELINLVQLVLTYLQTIYVALSQRTTATIDTLFVGDVHSPLSVKLSAYQFSASAFRDIVVDKRFKQISDRQWDSYGISSARSGTDLLAAIWHVAQQCKASPDDQLRSLAL